MKNNFGIGNHPLRRFGIDLLIIAALASPLAGRADERAANPPLDWIAGHWCADLDGVQSYIAQPGGKPPTAFKRTAGGETWARFENPDHDFPQRIEYRREGDRLHAEVAGRGKNGEEAVLGFDYRPSGS